MVPVGGLGTFEGPLVGAVVFFAIQHWFADRGAWYLIGLGATAVGFALFVPRGAWGWAVQRGPVQRFPVGYRRELDGDAARDARGDPGQR